MTVPDLRCHYHKCPRSHFHVPVFQVSSPRYFKCPGKLIKWNILFMRDVAVTKQNVFFKSLWSILIINFNLLKESDSFGWNGAVFYTAETRRYSFTSTKFPIFSKKFKCFSNKFSTTLTGFLGNSKQKWSNLKDDFISS